MSGRLFITSNADPPPRWTLKRLVAWVRERLPVGLDDPELGLSQNIDLRQTNERLVFDQENDRVFHNSAMRFHAPGNGPAPIQFPPVAHAPGFSDVPKEGRNFVRNAWLSP